MLVVSFSEIKSWQHTPYTITYINSRICNLLNQELNCTARTSLWIYKFEYLNKTFRSVGWLHFELTVVHAFVLRRFMINNNFEIVVRLKKCHKFFFMECHRYPGVKRQTVLIFNLLVVWWLSITHPSIPTRPPSPPPYKLSELRHQYPVFRQTNRWKWDLFQTALPN